MWKARSQVRTYSGSHSQLPSWPSRAAVCHLEGTCCMAAGQTLQKTRRLERQEPQQTPGTEQTPCPQTRECAEKQKGLSTGSIPSSLSLTKCKRQHRHMQPVKQEAEPPREPRVENNSKAQWSIFLLSMQEAQSMIPNTVQLPTQSAKTRGLGRKARIQLPMFTGIRLEEDGWERSKISRWGISLTKRNQTEVF